MFKNLLSYFIIIFLFISCNNDQTILETKNKEILKIKELGILKPFKCTIYNYSKKFDGYIVPYLYYIQNNTNSNIYKLNVETSYRITNINNDEMIIDSRLNVSNGCQIYDTSINTLTYDNFNPLRPKKSFHCIGFLTFINENKLNEHIPSPVNILDDGELLKYINSDKQIKTKFEVSSRVHFNDSHSHEFPEFVTLIYDTTNFMKDVLKFNNMNHKTFNGGEKLNNEIYNYIYTLLTKSKDDFFILQKFNQKF